MNRRTSLTLVAINSPMIGRFACLLACASWIACASILQAGDYDPQIGQPGSLGIAASNSIFVEWASTVASFNRGPQNIANPGLGLASVGTSASALGSVVGNTNRVVSLGDGGSITLGFDQPISNGPGVDFAVFENGFLSGTPGLAFLELGLVAVSSDGLNFFPFPAVSETPTSPQTASGGLLDATNLYDLAGKYIAGYGTGFDLSELASASNLLDVNHIAAVRITDVVGSIDPAFGTRDSLGNLINDPYPTAFASSGFDLNGVGVIHMVPEPANPALAIIAAVVLLCISCQRAFDKRRQARFQS